jgi:hypothetical protein
MAEQFAVDNPPVDFKLSCLFNIERFVSSL